MEVPHLFRNLAGNLIGANWMLIRLLAESKVVSQEDEGDRNAKPHADQGQHGCEGNCT